MDRMDLLNTKRMYAFLKQANIYWWMNSFFILIVTFTLYSCVESPNSKKSNSKSNTGSTTASNNTNSSGNSTLPNFQNNINFIQNGSNVYNSSVSVDLLIEDLVYLRGAGIDQYIRSTATASNGVCLAIRFPDTAIRKIVVVAGVAANFYNFTTKVKENYYSVSLNNEELNKSLCQKSGLISKLASSYPTLSLVYSLKNICSGTCTNSTYSSEALTPYNNSGSTLTAIVTTNLTMKINNKSTGSSGDPGKICTKAQECVALGYDCCSNGQCVKDKAVKDGTDTTALEFLQAQNDILSDPNRIYLYPKFYYLCQEAPGTTPTTPSTGDPVAEAKIRLEGLTNLYQCLNRTEGEMGVCSIEYDNPKIFDITKSIAVNEANGTGVFTTRADDRSFKTTFTNTDTTKETNIIIETISYGGKVIYSIEGMFKTPTSNSATFINDYVTINPRSTNYNDPLDTVNDVNDDLSTNTRIILKKLPENPINKKLVITYRADASCQIINTNLALCEKHYIQGQNSEGASQLERSRKPVTDHLTGVGSAQVFKLPLFADVDKVIKVELEGQQLTEGTDWVLTKQSPQSYITLMGIRTANDTHKVKIKYYVDRLSYPNVGLSRQYALTKIQANCTCQGSECNLAPVRNTANEITDYQCIYPSPPLPAPPFSQVAYLSSKSVPVRFFNNAGVAKSAPVSASDKQEGITFEYTSGDTKKPNNISSYVGFNEIYGTISTATGSAKAPKEVNVVKGKTYDLYTEQGMFSSCANCGNDYYSTLNKILPITQFAGGILPLRTISSRTVGDSIRSDDFAFGRACFVPATMIPWSHRPQLTTTSQRMGREALQHFYFANGYQRDWYGFDYGAVIGSFDGVKWFAIGTKRRIKAESNKLFLAVNAYFGDQTIESTFNVTVNDAVTNEYGALMPTSDRDTDAADCQRYHSCNNDQDCAATLGYEYACASVGEINTSWPLFDDNGNELADASKEETRLTSILGLGSTGKKCVYRGRGALCTPSYGSLGNNENIYFNKSLIGAHHACSANTSCQTIYTGGSTPVSAFNTRIARFGKSLKEIYADGSEDLFGLGAKILGRPFSYNGSETVRSELQAALNSNRVKAMCIPGRAPTSNTYETQNVSASTPEYVGDRVTNIGQTIRASEQSDPLYMNSCSTFDANKNYYYLTSPTTNQVTNPIIGRHAATQNISANALIQVNTALKTKGINLDSIFKPVGTTLSTVSYLQNSCLRAPGASCFADQECAPNKIISDKAKQISSTDSAVTAILNAYEIKFWQEELICSQKEDKASSNFDPKNNRCCRDIGKVISIANGNEANGISYDKVPAIDVNLNNVNRYSRVSTVYQDVKDVASTNNLPNLKIQNAACVLGSCPTTTTLTKQFKTFGAIASRTSCSESWVRSFNTGKHDWGGKSLQTFTLSSFKCLNWRPHNTGDTLYSCAGLDPDDPSCQIVQTLASQYKAKEVLKYLEKLELLGIPQIALETKDTFEGSTEGAISCLINTDDPYQLVNPYPNPNYKAMDIFSAAPIGPQYSDGGTQGYYSGSQFGNFKSVKKIFKEDEVVSCLPAGTEVAAGTDATRCCTGFIKQKNGVNRCALDDYSDLSVYTNRYVSSEGSSVSDSQIDSQTGYIKDVSTLASLACLKSMCASGVMAQGVLISNLKIPGLEAENVSKSRFLEGSVKADNANGVMDVFNAGLKLNNHLYCIPENLASSGGQNILNIYKCSE